MKAPRKTIASVANVARPGRSARVLSARARSQAPSTSTAKESSPATTSAPQHPTAEVHSDDERIVPSAPYCPGGEEASPCGYVQDRAFGQDVGEQSGLRCDRSAPHESARKAHIEVIERRNPPAIENRSASTVSHRLKSAGPHPLSRTLRSSARRLPDRAQVCTMDITPVGDDVSGRLSCLAITGTYGTDPRTRCIRPTTSSALRTFAFGTR